MAHIIYRYVKLNFFAANVVTSQNRATLL